MSTIQPNLSPVQTRARELMLALPQDADAEGRVRAASDAVDRLAAEFPQSPEASAMSLVKSLAAATPRGVTRETLLNTGLELAVRGAVAGSPYLASTALELSALGWDDGDKDTLLGAGYQHLRSSGVLPQPGAILKLAEKDGGLRHQQAILDHAAHGAGDIRDLAASLVKLEARDGGKWFHLAEGTLAYLAEQGPEEVRPGYEMAQTMMGSWFKKLGGYARTHILQAFVGTPLKSPADFASTAADAIVTRNDSSDLYKAGLRAMEVLEPSATPADRVALDLTRRAAGELVKKEYDPPLEEAQRVLAEGLTRFGQTSEVTGPGLAGLGMAIADASRLNHQCTDFLVHRCDDLAEKVQEGRWKAAFRDLGRLLPHAGDSYYSSEPLQAYQGAMKQMAAAGSGADPVEAMVRGVSGVGQGGDPAGVLSDFLAGKDTGSLNDTPIVRELLAVLAEDGSTPQMRGVARFIHRAMENGELKDGFKSMRDAFEIQEMARSGAENPGAIKLEDDSVKIGGVVIRRKADAPAA